MPTTRQKVDESFEELIPLLASTQLRTYTGRYRYASVDEFMFMGIDKKGRKQFKHSFTRNYVFVEDGRLIVPRTGQPFLLGFFEIG